MTQDCPRAYRCRLFRNYEQNSAILRVVNWPISVDVKERAKLEGTRSRRCCAEARHPGTSRLPRTGPDSCADGHALGFQWPGMPIQRPQMPQLRWLNQRPPGRRRRMASGWQQELPLSLTTERRGCRLFTRNELFRGQEDPPLKGLLDPISIAQHESTTERLIIARAADAPAGG